MQLDDHFDQALTSHTSGSWGLDYEGSGGSAHSLLVSHDFLSPNTPNSSDCTAEPHDDDQRGNDDQTHHTVHQDQVPLGPQEETVCGWGGERGWIEGGGRGEMRGEGRGGGEEGRGEGRGGR